MALTTPSVLRSTLLMSLAIICFSAVAQTEIQKREPQPDGYEIVSWSYKTRDRFNKTFDAIRYGLYDPRKKSLVLDMGYGRITYARVPGKYVVRDTTTFRHAFFDAKQAKFLSTFLYQSITEFQEGVSIVTFYDSTAKGSRCSILYPDGKRAPFMYDFMSECNYGRVRIKNQGKWGLMKPDGTVVLQPTYEDMGPLGDGFVSVRYQEEGLNGFINLEGKEVIPPSYEWTMPFVRNRAIVYTKNTGWKYTRSPGKRDSVGVINSRGEFLIPPHFVRIEYPFLSKGMFIVTNEKNKKAVYDLNGKLLQDFNIEYFGSWENGRAEVVISGWKRGVMDSSGRWLVRPEYNAVDMKRRNYFWAAQNGVFDIFDSTGRKLLTTDSASRVVLGKDYLLALRQKISVTVFDYKGKKIRTIEDRSLDDKNTGFVGNTDSIYLAYSNRTFIHDLKTNKQQVLTSASSVHELRDGLILLSNMRYFWTDLTGKNINSKTYPDVRSFSNGIALARVETGVNRFQLINRQGKEIAEVQGEPRSDYRDGVILFYQRNPAAVFAVDSVGATRWSIAGAINASLLGQGLVSIQMKPGRYQLYQVNGKPVSDTLFDLLGTANDGVISFKRGNRFGYMDYKGNVVIDPIYDMATNSSGRLMALTLGPQITLVDPKGKRLHDATYTAVREPKGGIIQVARDKRWGLVNAEGKTLVPTVYDDVIWAAENRVFIKKGVSWCLADYQGNSIGNLKFDEVHPAQEGFSRVKIRNMFGLLNMQGSWALNPIYPRMTDVQNQLVVMFESFGGTRVPIKN